MRLFLLVTSWGYLVLVVTLWLTMFFGGDRWWPATLILFGPRWLAALPLVILLPLTALRNRRLLFPLLAAAVVVFGPFMGLCIPPWKAHPSTGKVFRVLTCNIHNGSYNAQKLSALIRDSRSDIVALQECPQNLAPVLPVGWQTLQGKGLAILSRFPLSSGKFVQVMNPHNPWPGTCLLQCVARTPGGDLAFGSIHLPTARSGITTLLDRATLLRPSRKGLILEETQHRRLASREVKRAVASLGLPVVIAGDFNMPMESAIYRDSWKEFANAFSLVGSGYGLTAWRAVRGLTFGARVDHVLTGKGLKVLLCETGPDVGSDHLPLIADVERSDSSE